MGTEREERQVEEGREGGIKRVGTEREERYRGMKDREGLWGGCGGWGWGVRKRKSHTDRQSF